jgi:oligopeptide/dipeptide ABC transporter ATP-binding protein
VLTYLFITHNLSVVKHISNRIAVMYLGKIVEVADRDQFFEDTKHPYSKALISAIPEPGFKNRSERIILKGDLPSPVNPPSGCHFHTRCPFVMERCITEIPDLVDVGESHFVACHLHNE